MHDPIAGPTSGPVNRNKAKPVAKNRKQQAAKDDPSGPVGTRRGTQASKHPKPAPPPAKRQPSRADMTKKKRTEAGGKKQPLPVVRPKTEVLRGGK